MINKFDYYLLLIILANGVLWLRSSIGKLSSGKFVEELGSTLARFASKNPYPWYKDLLQNTAIPNSHLFGLLTQWGELLVALSTLGAAAYLLIKPAKNRLVLMVLLLGLSGGMFLNAVFWLASGWTSPSTDSLNLLMFGIQFIGAVFAFQLLRK